MIFAKHDFQKNYLNAINDNDREMTKDVIIDELAKLIVNNKTQIVKIMRTHGVQVSYSDNKKKISNVLTSEIGKNKELRNEISKLIVQYNVNKKDVKELSKRIIEKNKKEKKYHNQSGDSDTSDSDSDSEDKDDFFKKLSQDEKVLNSMGNLVAGTLSVAFGGDDAQSQQNKETVEQRVEQEEKDKEKKSAGFGKYAQWGILFVIVGTLVWGIINSQKGSSEGSSSE